MQRTVLYAFFMLLAATCFGLTSPIMKFSYRAGFDVQDVTNAQYSIALVVLLVIWLVRLALGKKPPVRMSAKQWLLLAFVGFGSALTSYGYYQALTVLPASLGIVLLFQFTWMVLLIDIIVTRKLPTWEKWIGLAAILVGTVLAVGVYGLRSNQMPVWAIVMGLLGGLGYATVLYASSYVEETGSPIFRSGVTVFAAMLFIAIPFRPTYLWSGTLWHGLWFWGLLVALSSQVFPLLLMLVAIPKIGGRMAGVLGSMELPVAVVAAYLLLGEHVTPLRWFGVVLILLGMIVSELAGSKRRARD
ncbi:DMT family transporter [Alicyclobacillus sp. SO9]|uniref:EamA family transporter n=1 Tax=Alicyclobacillus sp. SO9 TaxID=2665646 RepID=UPI0018E77FD4|nr:DMT family transporter [Alicyclobacillus sp. SO9]QQE78563.1 DMT family transporter [Alicyclobacillus sp. SO9]